MSEVLAAAGPIPMERSSRPSHCAVGRRSGRHGLVFVAWFGPVGIAALFYAMVAVEHGADEIVWHATAAVILASAVLHGITATPATRAYERHERKAGEDERD